MDTGRRICGSMDAPTGAVCRWTKPPFPSCSSICCGGNRRPFWEICNAGGRPSAATAGFILRNGPVTQQDRWEEDAGYSPFTLAVEISGLLAAADLADAVGQKDIATHLRETADCWNDNIERWVYAKDSDLARQLGVAAYYVRIAPPESDCAPSPLEGFVPIKNRPPGQNMSLAVHLISPDSLALVRFGLRAPDDSRILNTIKVIDALLKVNLP